MARRTFKDSLTRKLLEREATFLADIIEARSILSIHKDQNGNLMPFLAIDSSDKVFLECTKNLVNNGSVLAKSDRRTYWRFVINDYKGVMDLLGQVIPHLRVKQERGKILFNFCARRFSHPSYSKQDWADYEKLKGGN